MSELNATNHNPDKRASEAAGSTEQIVSLLQTPEDEREALGLALQMAEPQNGASKVTLNLTNAPDYEGQKVFEWVAGDSAANVAAEIDRALDMHKNPPVEERVGS